MLCVSRFAAASRVLGLGLAQLLVLTLVWTFVPAVGLVAASAQEVAAEARKAAVKDAKPAPTGPQHACLNQKERRAEIETGRLVRLSAAMRTARSRMPGTVVRARLCHGQIAGQDDGFVYVLTVLAHDGKVARIKVDAVKGTLIGGL